MKKKKGIRNTLMRRLSITGLAHGYTELRQPGLFDDVEAYCVFIGHGRSGSTLVGALLNAHPNVVLSNELDALEYIENLRTRDQLFRLIYYQAKRQARQGSKGGGGYTYAVPDQWQGRHRTIKVVGDRKSGATALRFHQNPGLVQRLRDLVDLPLKFISVVRNPFDTLATTFEKTPPEPDGDSDAHLRREINLYYDRTAAIQRICEGFGEQAIKFVYHEKLIENPRSVLAELCAFLGVAIDDQYLSDCAGIVRPSPSVTRTKIDWTDAQIGIVEQRLSNFAWLKHYNFSDA